MGGKTGGFDFKNIMDNIKSIVGQSGTPEPLTSDKLGQSMKSISEAAQKIAEDHADMTQAMHDLNSQVNQLYKDIDAFRQEHKDIFPSAVATEEDDSTDSKEDTTDKEEQNKDDTEEEQNKDNTEEEADKKEKED